MSNEVSKILGEVIKKARIKKSLTQQELSEKVNISRNFISDIERGRYTPSTENLILLAKTLEIDLNLLKNDGNTI
ncbi:transcriptional regulator with XRE-family HTH domain [Clostridium beijerinckii]|uniref:Transcriptional regulator with XRE-family HTH domain n=1 Tax=Clostridium beijerinckii TaxID=1520 RepID=A0AAX0AYT7_CLOBE|nr:helix-turn-helix transcriptional regulator [Clostridium beijerinckii]NOW84313.1 transcriptional regulator with XRE-family HTH domain [Clostridium beijerinckii]NRT34512.1 transcriptional regulator with XRE-family HTH domain [Clostridium beijerinckii]NRT46057.1 transcriptional regulator with XRE-family HTH domain [Clostridium beijerinckii]NRT88138.1 transcriptional regulator with XRE-family HTH domain [Clostridium beijerinckii]NRZ19941.1 transcriptional regulator with XRE-family HTH domain [C